jgi:hypothetical protein
VLVTFIPHAFINILVSSEIKHCSAPRLMQLLFVQLTMAQYTDSGISELPRDGSEQLSGNDILAMQDYTDEHGAGGGEEVGFD